MAIHERLPKQIHPGLKQLGWTKARELARVVRSEGSNFDCAPWVHKASTMPKEEFRREVDRYLTGKETEPWELLYFKVYKSQLPVIERALETATLMLGSGKSRGYCLEMICADFLAGAHLDDASPDTLATSLKSLVAFLPQERRAELLKRLQPEVRVEAK